MNHLFNVTPGANFTVMHQSLNAKSNGKSTQRKLVTSGKMGTIKMEMDVSVVVGSMPKCTNTQITKLSKPKFMF